MHLSRFVIDIIQNFVHISYSYIFRGIIFPQSEYSAELIKEIFSALEIEQ